MIHQSTKVSNYIFNKYFYEMLDCIYKNVSDNDVKAKIVNSHKVKNNNTLKNTDYFKNLHQKDEMKLIDKTLETGCLFEEFPLCQNELCVHHVFEKIDNDNFKTMIHSYVYLLSTMLMIFMMSETEPEDAKVMLDIVLEMVRKVQNSKDANIDEIDTIYDERVKNAIKLYQQYTNKIESVQHEQGESSNKEGKEKENLDTEDLPDFIKNTQVGKMGAEIFNECFDKNNLPNDPQNMMGSLQTIIGNTANYFDTKQKTGQLDLNQIFKECGSLFTQFTSPNGNKPEGCPNMSADDIKNISNMLMKKN